MDAVASEAVCEVDSAEATQVVRLQQLLLPLLPVPMEEARVAGISQATFMPNTLDVINR